MLHKNRRVAHCVIVMHKPLSLGLTAPLPPNYIAQPLQNLNVHMTSNTVSMRYELMMHQTVDVKQFRELLTAPRS
jgi:hypothetical protein